MRYRLQRHDGTDCSATMVPITVLRMVPIQRYRHSISTNFCNTPSIPLEKQKKSSPSFSKKKNTINTTFYKTPSILYHLLKNNHWSLLQPARSTSINITNNQAILNILIKIIKKEIPSRFSSTRNPIKYLQTAKLSFFCNNFERNFNRNFLVKFNDCFVMTNFFYRILNNDNLTIDVVTQFSQFFSNLNITN